MAITDKEVNGNDESSSQPQPSCTGRVWTIYNQYEFLILIVVGICIAKAYPPLGAQYLHPEITATWVAIIVIFCT
jgi:solute carrier family 10 (sodium/bile acid cotransporter), member 7